VRAFITMTGLMRSRGFSFIGGRAFSRFSKLLNRQVSIGERLSLSASMRLASFSIPGPVAEPG